MKIHFFGAARTTTGSMYLIEVNRKKLLLECGLFQGHRQESELLNQALPFNPEGVDAVILSHSHLDHAGKLPSLCQHYDGPIHCTSATRDLCSIMLLDSAHIQEQDALFVSKIRARKKLPPVTPLYTLADAKKSVQQLVPAAYDQPFEPVPGVTVTFRDAGHILGSAQVVMDVQETGRQFRYLFTGDIGRGGDELLRDPVPMDKVDYLQIESTYAGRVHEQRPEADDLVGQMVGATLKTGGKVIIPAFSVGRTQQIVYVLHE
ncbi:MAG TPA: MBL fold metallo-hydrolase, partial [Candidatus Acidoferrum sp.]|nr:MBL fold metallo-hydrolase [Candidatus Acidoferrum sp.]